MEHRVRVDQRSYNEIKMRFRSNYVTIRPAGWSTWPLGRKVCPPMPYVPVGFLQFPSSDVQTIVNYICNV